MSAKKRLATASRNVLKTYTFDTGTGEKVNGRYSTSWFIFRIYREILAMEESDIAVTYDLLLMNFKRKHKAEEKRFKDELDLAVKDKLIRIDRNVYKIDRARRCVRNDFYCFHCFKSEEGLRKCNSCWRVYHLSCFNYSDIRGRCFFCKNYPQEPVRQKILNKKEINDVLLILYNKVKKEHNRVVEASTYPNESSELINLIANFVYLYDITFKEMEKKIKSYSYETVIEFVFECRQVLFNLHVLYGSHSELARAANEMEKLVLSEEHFIHNCVDCYMNLANKGPVAEGDWFLIPCNPPHEVCFAQVEGYPHYPAKIIQRDEKRTFVWFFDGKRETANPPNRFILPKLPKNVKITPQLQKSIDEYTKYVERSEKADNSSKMSADE